MARRLRDILKKSYRSYFSNEETEIAEITNEKFDFKHII